MEAPATRPMIMRRSASTRQIAVRRADRILELCSFLGEFRLLQKILRASFALILAFGGTLAAEAATYPVKPIRLVVPFPAGGPLDVTARAIGQKLTEVWGQPVVVDNRPGAGGNIGADLVAKSAPDGYTILEGALSTHALNVSLYSKIPYDPVKDFATIPLMAITPNVLVLNP